MTPIPPSDDTKLFPFVLPAAKPDTAESLDSYDPPTPFKDGPYTVRDSGYIFSRDGEQIACTDRSGEGPANAKLLAASWELLTMLHEYTSTDACTDHAEGETCRYCVAMNVIRRAMGMPDETLPLLTWFSQYKEQRSIREVYQEKYEAARAKMSQAALYAEERMVVLRASKRSAEGRFPERVAMLGKAIAELGVVMVRLEK